MKQIIKALVSWPMLVVQCILLGAVYWGVAGNWISYFWWFFMLPAVLLGEVANKLWSPERQTLSNNTRDLSVGSKWDKVRFWAGNIIFFIFALTLIAHFCVRLF